MAVDLAKLPLVLCGPILRRVEPQLVSVFVALKHPRKVKLRVFERTGSGTPTTPIAGGEGEGDTIALGKYLHVCVVTVQPSAALRSGTTYAYDLQFTRGAGAADALDTGAPSSTLQSEKLLEGGAPLGYDVGALPTFAGPPADVSDLRLIHGSCRKPHGKGEDAMPAIDTLIANSRQEPLRRPHQLLLTGDQIYADDVSIELLPMLTELGTALLGWPESTDAAKDVRERLPLLNKRPAELAPDARVKPIKTGAKMSSDESHNHLMGLGEFLAMYLFVWSDRVWPQPLPSFGERYPEQAALIAQYGERVVPPRNESKAEMMAYAATARKQSFQKEMNVLDAFRKGLPAVRRALANVPTLMMFDDHEISDDWYMDRKWMDDVLGNELGRRVILNGLLAYAAFQGWGNDPRKEFGTGGKGAELLASLQTLTRALVEQKDDKNRRYDETSAEYGNLLRLLSLKPTTPRSNGVTWHYVVEWPTHRTLVLDTRTRRDYVGATNLDQPDLIGAADLSKLVGPEGDGGLLGKPAPASNVLTVVVSPAPVVGHPFVEHFVQDTMKDVLGGSRGVDRESWLVASRPQAFEDLLRRLSARGRVLLLSGDVHYGFMATVQYWNERPGEKRSAGFVQLVASGFKNQDLTTEFIGWKAAPTPRDFLGWPSPGTHLTKAGDLANLGEALLPISTTPAVAELRRENMTVDEPQWRYRILFSIDNRTAGMRGGPPAAPTTAGQWLLNRQSEALEHLRRMDAEQMRACVGFNNFGDVGFASNPPHLMLWQRLWYRVKKVPDVLPYSVHWSTLAPPDETVTRPAPRYQPTPLPAAERWADLMSFRPPLALQARIKAKASRDWYFHRIEHAWAMGPINLDYYPVLVRRLPIASSTNSPFTADELLGYVRRLLAGDSTGSKVVDTRISQFRPYYPDTSDYAANEALWSSADPTGTLISITMQVPLVGSLSVKVDSGSVMCTRYARDHWIFSTLYTPKDGYHPVSGNRMFGFRDNGDGTYTFFTRGADRLTTPWHSAAESTFQDLKVHPVFGSADALWKSFQNNLVKLIKDNQGEAEVLADETVSVRVDWLTTSPFCLSASTPWDDGYRP